MRQILVLIGAPGSGKGQQSDLLVRAGWQAVSSGQLLRDVSALDSPLGKEIQQCLTHGQLVPDHIMLQIMREHLAKMSSENIILDGFPRTLAQAQSMADMGIIPTHIVIQVIPDEVVLQRITGRWIEPMSGRVYHDIFHPPKVHGIDDINQRPLVRRDDDKLETAQARLALYHRMVYDIVPYYTALQQTHSIGISYVNANDSIQAISQAIASLLA